MKFSKVQLILALLLCFLVVSIDGFSKTVSNEMGTIIVTYQTDQEGQKLDRIRFWLINENHERTLYPKKDEFVANNHSCLERTVVIAHLPIGLYRIEFLIPNVDQIFEEVTPREIELTPGSVIKIDQLIRLRPLLNDHHKENHEIAFNELNSLSSPMLPVIVSNSPAPTKPPLPAKHLLIKSARFSLMMNLNANWRLMHESQIIYSGMGSANKLPIPPGRHYYLLVQEMPGYTFQMIPQNPFDLEPGEAFMVELIYRHETGYLDLHGIWPNTDKKLTMKLIHEKHQQPPQEIKLTSIGGKIDWQSSPLAIGDYLVIFEIPGQEAPLEKHHIFIQKGRRTVLNFPIKTKELPSGETGSLQVTTDIPQALFTLVDQKGITVGQGQGYSYQFKNLSSGLYELRFSSADPRLFIPPPAKEVMIEKFRTAEVKVNFEKMGRLTIGSNVDLFKVTIKPQKNDQPSRQETISARSMSIYLPEGHYTVSYEPLAPGAAAPKPTDISIRSTAPQTIFQSYSSDAQTTAAVVSKSTKNGIEVKSNLSNASFTLQDITHSPAVKEIGKYRGKSVFIPLDGPGEYRIIFNSVPNYTTPQPLDLKLQEGEHPVIDGNYIQSDSFVLVPAGPAIIGDPFSDNMENVRPSKEISLDAFEIAVYEVTNSQYTQWLNQAFKNKKAFWNPDRPGYITNADNLILCKTMEANPLSQISLQVDPSGVVFAPIPGKENYPVIEVTWYGANAYCQDKDLRLPTENEWEKAAGMALVNLQRYKYGFGSNEIDRTWANYREMEAPIGTIQVLTTPVGFYNGVNVLPLKARDRTQLKTHDAKSPVGAYDMSGNVWEWVSSSDDASAWTNKRIVKGGCFDSLEQGVRVAERLSLQPDHSDIYTGFRPARSI